MNRIILIKGSQMARSTYIYVVLDEDYDSVMVPVAAFTVKHEMLAWLKKHPVVGYEVMRFSDGAWKGPAYLSEKELSA